MNTRTASIDDKRRALSRALQQEVIKGGRVEQQTDTTAIVRYDAKVNHTLHLILTLVTLTLWGWVWIALSIIAAVRRSAVSLDVDDFGAVLRTKL